MRLRPRAPTVKGRLLPLARLRPRPSQAASPVLSPVRVLLASLTVWAAAAVALLGLAYLDARGGAQAAAQARRHLGAEAAVDGRLEDDLERAGHLFDRAQRRAGVEVPVNQSCGPDVQEM